MAERFSFLLVTLLTDIAALSKDDQVVEKVLAAQVEVLAMLTATLTKASASEGVHSTSAGKGKSYSSVGKQDTFKKYYQLNNMKNEIK